MDWPEFAFLSQNIQQYRDKDRAETQTNQQRWDERDQTAKSEQVGRCGLEKGQFILVNRWPFKLDIECCWGAEVYQCPCPAGSELIPRWYSWCCEQSWVHYLYAPPTHPFWEAKPLLYKEKVSEVEQSPHSLQHEHKQFVQWKELPAAFQGLLRFICHEIIKSPLLICGNAANISHGTNHFDKRFVCANWSWAGEWSEFLCRMAAPRSTLGQTRSMVLHVIDPLCVSCVCMCVTSRVETIFRVARGGQVQREKEKKRAEIQRSGVRWSISGQAHYSQGTEKHASKHTHTLRNTHTLQKVHYTTRMAVCVT